MAKRMDNSGSPQPGKAGLNYDHTPSQPSAGVDKAYNSRAKPKMKAGGTTPQPGSPGKTPSRAPQHYGERAHTKITEIGWPGKAAARADSDKMGGRGPRH